MSYRRSDVNDSRYERDRHGNQYDYHNRRDGETDRQDRDRPRHHHRSRSRSRSPDRDRGLKDRDIDREKDHDRPRDLEKLRPPTGPRDSRIPPRSFSSPVHSKSTNSTAPRRPMMSTTPTSSAQPTLHPANESLLLSKITAALRQLSQRSNEQGALQLRKDLVEARARDREKEHAQSHPRYAEFPSLKDCHRKLEKKDAEDLDALRKEVSAADRQWLTSAEEFATALLQAFAELQQYDQDRRPAASSSSFSDGLEARLNSRFDALEKRHKEDVARQQKQIADLQNGLSTETAQRKILGIENESLKKKVQDLQNQQQSLTSKVDGYGASIGRLQEERSKVMPPPSVSQQSLATPEYLTQVKAMVEQCRSGLTGLEATVLGHDRKLGEMDVDLITEGCVTIVATLPRLEQTIKRVADGVSSLRSDHDKIRLDNEKLRSNIALLQSDAKQLESHTQQLRSDADGILSREEQLKSETKQLKEDTQHLKSDTKSVKMDAEQLKSETIQLRSGAENLQLAVKKLRSEMQAPPAGDSFLTVKTFTDMNAAVFKTFSGWIEDVKKRVNILEGQISTLQTVSKQQNIHSTQIQAIEDQVKALETRSGQNTTRNSESSRVFSSVIDSKALQYEGKWKEHDTRIKALEVNSRRNLYQSTSVSPEPTGAADALAQKRAPTESVKAAIEALKAQVAMTDQSIKAVSGSARLTSDSQASQAERISQLEKELLATGRRLGAAEHTLHTTEEKFERKLEFMQQNFTSLDSQMNNLTTENLFQAIIQYIGRYQPNEALLGPRVGKIIQQMTAYEQRLTVLERTMAPAGEPANKKRKLSPHMGQVPVTNGRH